MEILDVPDPAEIDIRAVTNPHYRVPREPPLLTKPSARRYVEAFNDHFELSNVWTRYALEAIGDAKNLAGVLDLRWPLPKFSRFVDPLATTVSFKLRNLADEVVISVDLFCPLAELIIARFWHRFHARTRFEPLVLVGEVGTRATASAQFQELKLRPIKDYLPYMQLNATHSYTHAGARYAACWWGTRDLELARNFAEECCEHKPFAFLQEDLDPFSLKESLIRCVLSKAETNDVKAWEETQWGERIGTDVAKHSPLQKGPHVMFDGGDGVFVTSNMAAKTPGNTWYFVYDRDHAEYYLSNRETWTCATDVGAKLRHAAIEGRSAFRMTAEEFSNAFRLIWPM